MAIEKSETQAYNVIKVEEAFEIRYYPSAIMATITSPAQTYSELGSAGFTKLAGYIFGGNKANTKIAMTSPVHMDIGNSVSSMSFVMPSNYTKDNLPAPNDSSVTIKTTSAEYVAAIKFGGFATKNNIKKHIAILENALKKQALSYHGNFRFLGYNPPYQLFGRRNEIIVTLHWN
jgi:SOUL heme-binding protein